MENFFKITRKEKESPGGLGQHASWWAKSERPS